MATTKLNFERDINGYNAFAPDFPTLIWSATLTNGAETTFTVPGNFQVWVMALSPQPGSNIWVARNTTAAIPVGNTLAATNSELNPAQRRVYADDVIHVITANTTADVEIALYAISQ